MMLQEHDYHVGAARSAPQFIAPSSRQPLTISDVTHCDLTVEGHCITCSDEALSTRVYSRDDPCGRPGNCITCSDEALSARVLSIDAATGLALVAIEDTTEEIDISLVDEVSPGDTVLVHGGIAIANLEEANDE